MPVRKTRSHKVWIMADTFDYDFYAGRKNPLDADWPDADWSLCREGFRRVFGGLGIRPYTGAKRYKITIEEIS